jgi:hypothetical protein
VLPLPFNFQNWIDEHFQNIFDILRLIVILVMCTFVPSADGPDGYLASKLKYKLALRDRDGSIIIYKFCLISLCTCLRLCH